MECAEAPDPEIPGVKHVHAPILPEKDGAPEEDPPVNINGVNLPDLKRSYRTLVSPQRKSIWSQIFAILLENNAEAVLFHCSEGKDRTGVVIAIILSALSICKEKIYEDYLLTNQSPLAFREYAKQIEVKEIRELILHYFEANKEYLDEAFSEIDRLYGSLGGFFSSCCDLDEKKIAALRAKYLKAN